MANIIIAGNTAVITSAFTMDQLKKLEKYAPQSLCLKDAEGKKTVFMVATGNKGSVSAAGIVFNASAYDGTEKAVLSMEIPAGVADIGQWAMDSIGTSIMKLNDLEAQLPAALEAVAANEQAVRDCISVVGAEPTV